MATISEVKNGLDRIAAAIRGARTQLDEARQTVETQVSALENLATTYADVVAEIEGYVPTGAFETLSKDELDKLVTEYSTLLTAAQTAADALA
jgi:archaellum component FlaC